MEKEISELRKDLTSFMDWAKQSQESNQKNLSILNENFNLLLKLLTTKDDAVKLGHLNTQHVANTNKNGNKVGKTRKRDRKALYDAANDISDDEDLEDSLKIKPISLKMFSSNVETSTDKIERRKSLIYEHEDKKLNSETGEDAINTKALSIDGRRRCTPVKFSGKIFEQNLRELKRKYDSICKKIPNVIKLPNSYLEYGAARGWSMKQIRMKYHKHLHSLKLQTSKSTTCKTMHTKSTTMKKRVCLKNRNISSTCGNPSPVLNLTPEQLKANIKALREEHKNSIRRRPVPDFYFQFGAARGWTLRQVAQKYNTHLYNDRIKSARK